MNCSTPGFPVCHQLQACSNSCPLNQWCLSIISSSAPAFSSCPQSFPASGSFLMSQLFASGDQSIGASALVLPMNIQGQFPLGLTGLFSLQSRGLSRASVVPCSPFVMLQLSHLYTKWNNHSFNYTDFVGKVMSLLFSMLSRLVITFLPRSK